MAKKKEKINEKAAHKTNAVRLVETEKIPYELFQYDAPQGFLDGVSVAHALGQNPAQVFKTLVTISAKGNYYVCVIPVDDELDLKKAAKHFNEKKIEMLPARQITDVTGYIKGGCSPVGMKKLYPTAIDSSAQSFQHIMVSGGRVGLQIKIPLKSLLQITRAQTADLTVE